MWFTDRRLELWAVVLISVASVLSAWCAYESARWGSVQAQSYAKANATRVESLRQSDAANRQTMIDVNLFVAYANALSSNNNLLANFLAQRMPERLKVALQAWRATKPLKNPKAPSSPFFMKQYHLVSQDQADALERRAGEYFEAGVIANETGDRYILMTVIFASVSFLAGVGSKFDVRNIIITALALGSCVLIVAGTILTSYPVH